MANQYLSLALFIMLLSFFIILNSMASYDEDKAIPVMNSISQAFSTKQIETNIANSTISEEKIANKTGSSIDRMKALFHAHISGFKSQENRFGNEMYATLPLREFEKAMTSINQNSGATFDGAAGKFLPLLISILKSEETTMPYRMDIILNAAENPASLQNKNPETLENLIKKAALFSNILEQVGLPKKLISTGVEQGDEKYVSLAFRPYTPYSPLSDKKGGAE